MNSNHHRPRLKWLAVLLAVLAVPAAASTFIITEDELDPEIFPAVAEAIRANLAQLPPRNLSNSRRKAVLRSLERLERYFDEDPQGHRWRIDQERVRVNSMLAPAVAENSSGAEVVCQRVKRIGTNIPSTRCRDRLEIENEREAAQKLLTTPGIPHISGSY